MRSNPEKFQSRFELGRHTQCNSDYAGREGKPARTPSGLTCGNVLNVAAILFLQNEPIMYMKTKAQKIRGQ